MEAERRFEIALLALAALIAAGIVAGAAQDLILYNPSPSIPRGFYIRSDDDVTEDAIVTVRAVDVAPDYARLRRFDDANNRFIKWVAAVDGDEVCAYRDRVIIRGGATVRRAERDSAGRDLPQWTGCRILQDQVLLLGETPDSFDGRYWGPVAVSDVEGVWRPLWVW